MSVLRHRLVGRASVSALALAVVVALSFLTQGLTGAADGSSFSSGEGSVSHLSSELGVVPATPRASFGKPEADREHRAGFGPTAQLLTGTVVFTLAAADALRPSAVLPAAADVVGLSLARAPPATSGI